MHERQTMGQKQKRLGDVIQNRRLARGRAGQRAIATILHDIDGHMKRRDHRSMVAGGGSGGNGAGLGLLGVLTSSGMVGGQGSGEGDQEASINAESQKTDGGGTVVPDVASLEATAGDELVQTLDPVCPGEVSREAERVAGLNMIKVRTHRMVMCVSK